MCGCAVDTPIGVRRNGPVGVNRVRVHASAWVALTRNVLIAIARTGFVFAFYVATSSFCQFPRANINGCRSFLPKPGRRRRRRHKRHMTPAPCPRPKVLRASVDGAVHNACHTAAAAAAELSTMLSMRCAGCECMSACVREWCLDPSRAQLRQHFMRSSIVHSNLIKLNACKFILYLQLFGFFSVTVVVCMLLHNFHCFDGGAGTSTSAHNHTLLTRSRIPIGVRYYADRPPPPHTSISVNYPYAVAPPFACKLHESVDIFAAVDVVVVAVVTGQLEQLTIVDGHVVMYSRIMVAHPCDGVER